MFVVIVNTAIDFVCVHISLSQFLRFAHPNTFLCVCVRCFTSFVFSSALSQANYFCVFALLFRASFVCLPLFLRAQFLPIRPIIYLLTPVGIMSCCKKNCTIKCADDSEQPRFIYCWLCENFMHAKSDNDDDNVEDNENLGGLPLPLLDGSGFVRQRSKPKIIRFRSFNLNTDRLVMLYFSWRIEEIELYRK